MLVRRSAVESVGMMDEDFTLYYEDVDWCKRLHAHGSQVVCKTVSAVHHAGGSHSKMEPWLFGRYRVSMLLYFRKHLGSVRFHILLAFLGMTASLGLALRTLQRASQLFDASALEYHIEKYRFFFKEYQRRKSSFAKH